MTNSRWMQFNPTIQRAATFALAAHSAIDQRRKYTNAPYFVHVDDVAQRVAEVPNSNSQMVAAAYLHDTMEDTKITVDVIRDHFGEQVARMVSQLTDVSGLPEHKGKPRAERKYLDRAALRIADSDTQTIKLADVISNLSDAHHYEVGFAKIYFAEKRLLIAALTSGDKGLWTQAFDMIERYYAQHKEAA